MSIHAGDSERFADDVGSVIVRLARSDVRSTAHPVALWTEGARVFLVFRLKDAADRYCGWSETLDDPDVLLGSEWGDAESAGVIIYHNNIASGMVRDSLTENIRWFGSTSDLDPSALPLKISEVRTETMI